MAGSKGSTRGMGEEEGRVGEGLRGKGGVDLPLSAKNSCGRSCGVCGAASRVS